jgi:cell wall-associated NlpC family hydrolase
VLTAIASTTSADEALGSLGDGLALMEARRRVDAEVVSRVEAPPGAQSVETTTPVPTDPSKMPPASAGSNGTQFQRHSAADGAKIFAHARAGHDGSTSILLTGVALPPPDAPQAVQDVISNANMIVGRPYVWGGGHASFYSNSYDCSGAVSFALFGGGMIPRPLTSSELEGWGAPGPGKWITVYANGGHTFAEIAGLRWDTVGDEQGTGPRWHLASASADGFVVRHPPGY